MNQRANWIGVAAMVMVFGFGVFALADDPKDLNCDFETGLDKWRGNGRLNADEKGNKVCELKKSGKRTAEITHAIQLPGDIVYEIQYRVRAMPGSENVRIRRVVRSGKGAGFSGSELTADGKWVEQKFHAKAEAGDLKSDRVIAIVFYEGTGVIQVDDIRVVPKA